MLIPRLFYVEAKFCSRENIGYGGLEVFLQVPKEEDYITTYKLLFYGIIVHDTSSDELFLVAPGDYIVLGRGYKQLCRWHSGTLLKRDDPLKRRYCTKGVYSGLGYCREHNDSLRAIYDRCFSAGGLQSLGACKRLDIAIKNRLTYVVYLLDYGIGLKVGSTRSWRLYERIGEQPHVAAVKLYEETSALRIRELEVELGRKPGLTERPKKRGLKEIIYYPPRKSYKRLLDTSRKIIKEIRSNTEINLFRVLPEIELTTYSRAENTVLERITDRKLEVINCWAGYLLLSEPNTDKYYVIKGRELLHRNSIEAIK